MTADVAGRTGQRGLDRSSRLLSRPELGARRARCWSSSSSPSTAGDSGLFSAKGIVNFLEVSAQLGILAAAGGAA